MGRFVLLGLLTAAVGEWQFSVFLRGDLENFAGSLAFNAVYLAGVYFLSRPFLRALRRHPRWVVLYAAVFGAAGLLVEWFLIGNSPWGNPQASQIGMFAYWSCIALVPLACSLEPDALRRPLCIFIVRYTVVYVVLAVLGQWALPHPEWRFTFHIHLVIIGYLGLMGGILWQYGRIRTT